MSLGQLPSATDFNATWNYLEDGLDQILNRFDEGLTSVRYTLLYRYSCMSYRLSLCIC